MALPPLSGEGAELVEWAYSSRGFCRQSVWSFGFGLVMGEDLPWKGRHFAQGGCWRAFQGRVGWRQGRSLGEPYRVRTQPVPLRPGEGFELQAENLCEHGFRHPSFTRSERRDGTWEE
jgi:hypothetical protein